MASHRTRVCPIHKPQAPPPSTPTNPPEQASTHRTGPSLLHCSRLRPRACCSTREVLLFPRSPPPRCLHVPVLSSAWKTFWLAVSQPSSSLIGLCTPHTTSCCSSRASLSSPQPSLLLLPTPISSHLDRALPPLMPFQTVAPSCTTLILHQDQPPRLSS